MTDLRRKIENAVLLYLGLPLIDTIKNQIFKIANKILKEEDPGIHVMIMLEDENTYFTGRVSLVPIPESTINSLSQVISTQY